MSGENIFISLHLQSVNKISASSNYINIMQYCIFEPELQARGVWTTQKLKKLNPA